jgi:hypothetical protein
VTPPAATHAGHAQKVRRKPSPAVPRRVSGPVGGRERGQATARPSRPAPQPRRSALRAAPLGARAAQFVRSLPDQPLLDRVVRGRAWIPLLGVLLAGIVAMQVEVLKLGATMGRAMTRTTALQSRNELLRANVASLADQQRIETLAGNLGMVMPAPDGVRFLPGQQGGRAQAAASNIHSPDPSGFLSALASSTATSSLTPGAATSPTAGGTSTPSGAPTGTSTPAATPQSPAAAATQGTPGQSTGGAQTPNSGQSGAPLGAAAPAGGAVTQVQSTPPTTTQSGASAQGGTPTGGAAAGG